MKKLFAQQRYWKFGGQETCTLEFMVKSYSEITIFF